MPRLNNTQYAQIGRLVRRFEQGQGNSLDPNQQRTAGSTNVQFVRATSTSPTSGRYPGKWLEPVPGTPGSWTTKDDIWIVFIDGSAPDDTSTNYTAKSIGFQNGRPTFLAWKSGGGSGQTIQDFHGFQIKNSTTQSPTAGAWTDVTFGTVVFDQDPESRFALSSGDSRVTLTAVTGSGNYDYFWMLEANVYTIHGSAATWNMRIYDHTNSKTLAQDVAVSTTSGRLYASCIVNPYLRGTAEYKVQVLTSTALTLIFNDSVSTENITNFRGHIVGRYEIP